MCASSCSTVASRAAKAFPVTWERKRYWSRIVTAAAFSMAPAENSGTNTRSNLVNG